MGPITSMWLILECIVEAIDFRTCLRFARCVSNDVIFWQPSNAFKVHVTPKTNFVLFERLLKMMKDGVNLFLILIFVFFCNMQIG